MAKHVVIIIPTLLITQKKKKLLPKNEFFAKFTHFSHNCGGFT